MFSQNLKHSHHILTHFEDAYVTRKTHTYKSINDNETNVIIINCPEIHFL